jgi:GNAT superfamily N-acetyltransferase
MDVRVVPFDHPDSATLITEVQQEYVRRYGGPDETPVEPAEFAPPQGVFLIGYAGALPVACGGWRDHDGDAEIKRMFVVPAARGKGLARRLLAELERTAATSGRTRVILETGPKQPEAIALYRSAGYRDIAKFGFYREFAGSVCLAKHVDLG